MLTDASACGTACAAAPERQGEREPLHGVEGVALRHPSTRLRESRHASLLRLRLHPPRLLLDSPRLPLDCPRVPSTSPVLQVCFRDEGEGGYFHDYWGRAEKAAQQLGDSEEDDCMRLACQVRAAACCLARDLGLACSLACRQ